MIILGLGCNIDDRLASLREALNRLRQISEVKILKVSPVYESDALLLPEAPEVWNQPFLNLALGIATKLLPKQLLIKLKEIEASMGRSLDSARWSPRIIDIDILAWHEEYLKTDKLNIPHLSLLERPFALWPLADIDPDWKYCEPNNLATGKSAGELSKKFGSRFDGNAPLHTKQIAHRVDTPLILGILNLTPDSFSEYGKLNNFELVNINAKKLFAAGADIIDVGAESTRPNSNLISVEEEWSRLKPFFAEWSSLWPNKNFRPKLSLDTRKPEIVEKALAYGIDFLNDVSGFTNPKMQEAIKNTQTKIIFMHNLGIPADPKTVFPENVNVVSSVYKWGKKQLDNLTKFGFDQNRLIFDVGIGFGKNAEQSWALITNIKKFQKLGVEILVGHSRKSFLNKFTSLSFSERDLETAAVSGFLATQGVNYLRVHDVDVSMRLLKMNAALG